MIPRLGKSGLSAATRAGDFSARFCCPDKSLDAKNPGRIGLLKTERDEQA